MGTRIVWIAVFAGVALTVAAVGMASSQENAALSPDQDLMAQAPPPGPPQGRGPRPDLRQRLNLTDEQARRVDQITAAFRSRTEQLRVDLARSRLDAREAFLQATPDRARLDTIARRVGELQGQLTQARFGMLLELKTVLNPEQWNRFRSMEGPRGRIRRGR